MNKYQPIDFKWRHFHGEVIMQCVRWYCKYGISYRDLEEMMTERGLTIDHTTVYRWVQHYAPELKKRLEWHKKRYARVMRMFKKGQFNCWIYGNRNEVSFINEQFGLYS